MATHSSTLALKIPWMEEPGRSLAQATIHGVAKSQARLSDFTSLIHLLGIPGGSDSKASACNAGDPGSIPGLERFPGEGNGNPLQYSSILAWRIPWTEEPGELQSGLQESDMT